MKLKASNKNSDKNELVLSNKNNSAQIGSSGDYAKIGSSGNYAKIDSTGNSSVIASIGIRNIVKAKKCSWITLAEYKQNDNSWVVDFLKTEQVNE